MEPEHPIFLRIYGRGDTKITLKVKDCVEFSVITTNEIQIKLDKLKDRMVKRLEKEEEYAMKS